MNHNKIGETKQDKFNPINDSSRIKSNKSKRIAGKTILSQLLKFKMRDSQVFAKN